MEAAFNYSPGGGRFRQLPSSRHFRREAAPAAASTPSLRRVSCSSGGLGGDRNWDEKRRMGRMFVFGTGFVGRYVSHRLAKEQGWEVSGTCRSAAKKKELKEMGIEAFLFDANVNELKILGTLQHASHLLVCIPPVAGIGDPLLCLHEDIQSTLSNVNLQWLGYLSSTSVYGDCGGAWVNEDYPANPVSKSAKARLAAEKGWMDLGRDISIPVNIFRLGGIYGPGRSALDTIIKRETLSRYQKMRESRQYTPRVHVADIYEAIKASFDVTSSGEVYNVVDDDPAPRTEVFTFARYLLEEKWPGMLQNDPSVDAVGSEEIQEKDVKGEKRVSNFRLKKELGVNLVHPSYRSGLRSILQCWEPPL